MSEDIYRDIDISRSTEYEGTISLLCPPKFNYLEIVSIKEMCTFHSSPTLRNIFIALILQPVTLDTHPTAHVVLHVNSQVLLPNFSSELEHVDQHY